MKLSKYEKARIIGVRAAQLSEGAPPAINVEGMEKMTPEEIAKKELELGKIPLVVLKEKKKN